MTHGDRAADSTTLPGLLLHSGARLTEARGKRETIPAGDCTVFSTAMAILLLAGLSLILSLPGLWLLRKPALKHTAIAAILLLAATACAWLSVRLWLDRAQPVAAFHLDTLPGRFQVVTPADLPAALAAARGRPVLLEFYADWCTSCVTWKKTVFSRADVQAAMAPLVLLQVDASDLTPSVQQLLDRHGLTGLPALLAYDRKGMEHPELRLLGEMTAPDFMRWINNRLLPAL